MSLVFCSSFYVETVNVGLLSWHIYVGKSRMDRGACGQTSQDGHSGRGALHSQVECQGKESKVVHEESGEHSKLIKTALILSRSDEEFRRL